MGKLKSNFASFRKRLRNNQNAKFPLFILFALLGYSFFLSSNVWFPDLSKARSYSPMDTVYTLDNRDFTLKNWAWSPTQNLMEIEIDVDNKNYDSLDKYLFSCRDKKYTPLPTKAIIEEKNLLIIHITDVPPDFNELSFRIKVDYGEDTKETGDMVRFYTNRNDVSIVDEIKPLTINQYYIARLGRGIEAYKKEIDAKKAFISDINFKIAQAEEDISLLRNSIPIQSMDEASLSQKKIDAIGETISDFLSQIENAEQEIFEIEDKIRESEEKLKLQEVE